MRPSFPLSLILVLSMTSCATNSLVLHDPFAKQAEAEYREIARWHAAYGNSAASSHWNERADQVVKKSDAKGESLDKFFDMLFFGVINSQVGK